ncbi:MAG: histidinol dehydrogenase [Ruminococcaceae bacterium]|nr:histidinol dehydrogenase [Oscillospiraceae bacterium]
MIKIYERANMRNEDIFIRSTSSPDVCDIVRNIIADVIENGDTAVKKYEEKFDKCALTSLEVTKEEIDEAWSTVDAEFISVMEKAAKNIIFYHEHQKREGFRINKDDGCILGQKIIPLQRAGLYVPGGTAAYPSSVLMNCIPAKIAGVDEIVMTTPPNSEGKINPIILCAAKIAGVDRIFKAGGAQAIAALAYGTESVPKVDKIVGPGNAFVAEAKRQVFGIVNIDMIAGPSEILIVADESCDEKNVAADLLSQAEHDRMASAVLVTPSRDLANRVAKELEVQLSVLPREDIARTSVDNNGKIIICESIDECIDIANDIAPEHLEICVDEPMQYLDKIRNAGSVFLGKNTPEALGDYFAGTNHTLPTGGTARFSSPLSVDDFIKKYSYTYYTKDALMNVASDIEYFAEREGLSAHARSVTVRRKTN